MKNVLKINHKTSQIVMDRMFAIKSSLYGSQEYNNLQQARQDYPTYSVARKEIRKNPQKESFNGLTYKYMEMYMEKNNVSPEIKQKYKEMRFMSNCHSIRYPIIKKWFLETFPEIKNWGKIKKELAAADVPVSA
ncbi:MAG: hypothetical protein E7353_09265 [Clostridiales bacterium]|nr:hypothetical protein [Clostridiales bacterium]